MPQSGQKSPVIKCHLRRFTLQRASHQNPIKVINLPSANVKGQTWTLGPPTHKSSEEEEESSGRKLEPGGARMK